MQDKRFHQMSRRERVRHLMLTRGLNLAETQLLLGESHVDFAVAENGIENAIGFFHIPLGMAMNLRIDGQDRVIPMAIEETSVIAALSAAGKFIAQHGDIQTRTTQTTIIGQIEMILTQDLHVVKSKFETQKAQLIESANRLVPNLVARHGGVEDIELRTMPYYGTESILAVIQIRLNPCDAMGANLVNQLCESLRPLIAEMLGESPRVCILSNFGSGNMTEVKIRLGNLPKEFAEGIEHVWRFAMSDPFRACTHNKGIMNGIDGVLIATGNDWRAVEAGLHAHASSSGRYQPLSTWRANGNELIGEMTVPLSLGTVGGMTKLHPVAQTAMRLLGVQSATELARVTAAVGLVQNFAALKALSTDGIVKGHMQLHASNLAMMAGATQDEIPTVVQELKKILEKQKRISVEIAQSVLASVRRTASTSI